LVAVDILIVCPASVHPSVRLYVCMSVCQSVCKQCCDTDTVGWVIWAYDS